VKAVNTTSTAIHMLQQLLLLLLVVMHLLLQLLHPQVW